MRVVKFSEARNGLKKVIDRVVADADIAVIKRRDAPDAVLMSLDTFNSMMETVHLLKSPANAAHLTKSIAQLRAVKKTPRSGSTNLAEFFARSPIRGSGLKIPRAKERIRPVRL